MQYYILRQQTEETHDLDPFTKEKIVQVKFFPIADAHGKWLTLEADDADTALWQAKQRFPYLRLFLSVQDVQSYEQTLARLHAFRLARKPASGFLPRHAPAGATA